MHAQVITARTMKRLQVQLLFINYQNGQLAIWEGASLREIGKSGEISKRFSNHPLVFKLETHTLTTLDSSLVPSPGGFTFQFELQEYREDFVQSFFDLV
jgi:hypothetical protein